MPYTVTSRFALSQSGLLDETNTAQILGCSIAWLRKGRVQHFAPPFVKIGRMVRYNPEAIAAYINAHVRLTDAT